MARKEVQRAIEGTTCDVDGCLSEDASALPWTLKGQEFDLCAVHRVQLGRSAPARKSAARSASEVKAIREWAGSKGKRWAAAFGYEPRGRISNAVRAEAKKEGII